ncbi:MAG: carboxymuconolactone decarboxylase family protein [Bacteroidota bacterium]
MKDYQVILDEAKKGMGFVPNSLQAMAAKPNILGSFSMLFANVRGFSTAKVSVWKGLQLQLKNMRWMIQAKKAKDQEVPTYLKDLVAHVSSNAAGCRYCQAHTAHTAHRHGVEIEKLQKVWEFQTSDLFSEAERAALSFAQAAGSVPNQVSAEHHAELEKYYSQAQIVEIAATVAVFGFLNRWNDSMATQIEDEPFEFASKHLSANWEAGKHRN